jgi:hypothetical protein
VNRRKFLAVMAAVVPLGLAAGWWRWRGSGRPSSVAVGGRGAAPGALPAAAAAPGATSTAGPGSAADAAADLPPLRYGAGLPIRWQAPSTFQGTCARALTAANRHIQAHCTNLGFANGAIHGVRALGRDLALGDGDPYRALLENYTQESWVEGRTCLEVPVQNEGHRNAMLKTLVERQCDFDLEFQKSGRTYRFRDYVDSARLLHTYDLSVLPIDEQSWTIMAFVRVTPPEQARWRNLHGSTLDLDRMIDDTSQALARDTEMIRQVDFRQRELPRDCPVYARACGGLHMVYALAAALSSGYTNPGRRAEFAEHMKTLVRRFTYDMRVIDQVEALNIPNAGEEAARIGSFSARVKSLGHSFETIGLVDQFKLYEFTPAERAEVNRAREMLCAVLAASEKLDLGRYRNEHELYESLVGDICHAYNGLRMSPG